MARKKVHEQGLLKLQVEEQMAGFFKTGIESAKQLKVTLAETKNQHWGSP